MILVYFFYGTALIVLGLIAFLMPRRNDYFGLRSHLWSIGLFGMIHGSAEWIEMLALTGRPFDPGMLRIAEVVLLPLSYLFLLIFGASRIAGENKKYGSLIFLVLLPTTLWSLFVLRGANAVNLNMLARYFICIPGAMLTAFVLYRDAKRSAGKDVPVSASFFAIFAAGAFVFYGIFAGLTTQRAAFFPATIFNIDNLTSVFNIPAQVLRMLCAVTMAVSFAGMAGYFSKNKAVVKGTIARKITLIILISVSIAVFVGIFLTYLISLNLITDSVGREYVTTSNILAADITKSLQSDVEDTKVYTRLPAWIDIVKSGNLKYAGMNKKEMESYFKDMDKKWVLAKKGDPLLWEYLNNRVSTAMRDIVKLRGKVAELFLTDQYGGLVASSDKTSDFYQADEDWWRQAYAGGEGRIYISGVEFDESSSKWAVSIAVPMYDTSGSVMGVCKNSIRIERLTDVLRDFRLGKTSQVFLTDGNGRVIYYDGKDIAGKQLFTQKEIKALLSKKARFVKIRNKAIGNGELFIAFSDIDLSGVLPGKDTKWIVFVSQDASEVSRPIHVFIMWLFILAILLIIFMAPLSWFFGELVASPVRELRTATEHILAGDLTYMAKVFTKDEVGDLADTFNKMVIEIKQKQEGLEDLSRHLETKVLERTKALTEVQDATLNILEDLEESKLRLEESNRELRQLDRLKSDFVSTVSHELRTPLSIIKEGVSLVIDKVPGGINEKQAKILEIAKFNIDRLARIIDSLLDISKIEAGKVELKRNLIDIAEIVRQVASSFEMKVAEKGLRLKINIADNVGKVYADPDRIAQVLVNLIGNSIKFTNSGYIEVSCADVKDSVACSVRDTGVGIAKSDLPKIFDKFQQFGRMAGAGEKGTGLGLSIAKGIINMHNGSISVESEYEKGSRFTFTLHRYTEQALFREFTDKAIEQAAAANLKLSVMTVCLKNINEAQDEKAIKELKAVTYDCTRLIRNTLRRQGDDVISNNGDILVMLMDCSKEQRGHVSRRMEQALLKYLKEKKLDGKFKVESGCATFPDDGDTGTKLVDRSRLNLHAAGSVKA